MRLRVLLAAAFVLLVGCSNTADHATGDDATPPDMPAFSDELQAMQDFYRIEFLSDGYPGRRDDGEVWAHPIYGTYVLNDYLRQHGEQPTDELEEAIRTVADAIVDRMSEHRGTLVFWYEADPERGARLYDRHYSGLTQAYYAVALHRAGERLGDETLTDAAARVFDSLLVPVEDGGVWHDGPSGPGVAEVPQEPVSWILNGWQSALLWMDKYAELARSQEAREAVRESSEAMGEMLPLYDIPKLANSRYGLTGFVYLRLTMEQPVAVSDVSIEVPGEATYPVPVGEGTRWQNHISPDEVGSRSMRMNVVLSRVSHPEPNRLRFTVGEPMQVTVDAYLGDYDPLSTAPVEPEWTEIARVAADGPEVVEIPDRITDRVAYPTNFVKEIAGENVNVYHPLHVHRLRQLADKTGVVGLAEWADQWESYVCRWTALDIYDGLSVSAANGEQGTVEPATFC